MFYLTQERDGIVMNESMDDLVKLVHQWGEDRLLYQNSTAMAQTLKAVSEMGELADNVLKGRHEAAQDDVGDIIVCLIHVARLLESDVGKCLNIAYNDIKDRRGHFSEAGAFVKEGDVE